MMPGTIAIPQCWGHAKADGLSHARAHPGVNSNLLAGDGAADVEPLSGMSHLSGILVELRAAQPEIPVIVTAARAGGFMSKIPTQAGEAFRELLDHARRGRPTAGRARSGTCRARPMSAERAPRRDAHARRRRRDVLRGGSDAPALPAHRLADAQVHRRQRRRDLLRRGGEPGPRVRGARPHGRRGLRLVHRRVRHMGRQHGDAHRRRAQRHALRRRRRRAASRSASAASPRARNWLALGPAASRITTRHYYENEVSAAADPKRNAALEIATVGPTPPPAAPSDVSLARGIRRVARFVSSRTLGMPPMANATPPPLRLDRAEPVPEAGAARRPRPRRVRRRLLDGAVPDRARPRARDPARWPKCRCANVSLWNALPPDLRLREPAELAEPRADPAAGRTAASTSCSRTEDPGHPNWIDTEGRAFGIVFWRFMLAEGEIETPRAEMVPLAEVRKRG